jgi:hypothetical protein
MLARMVCVTFAIEDTQGWSQILSLYNFPGTLSATRRELDTIFPLNTILIIREPVVKMELAASQSHIRVDTPSDVIFVEPNDPLLESISWATGEVIPFKMTQSIAQWKATGDQHFKYKQFFAATVAYTYALQRDPFQTSIRLNRCLAYIRLGNFAHALSDANAVLESKDLRDDDKVKALYRAAQSEYGECRYLKAKKWYLKCLNVNPKLEDAKTGCQRCEARIREQKSGEYDWRNLFEASLSPSYRPDIAEFRGPVTITSLPHRGGGRGVTATRDINNGELLASAIPHYYRLLLSRLYSWWQSPLLPRLKMNRRSLFGPSIF